MIPKNQIWIAKLSFLESFLLKNLEQKHGSPKRRDFSQYPGGCEEIRNVPTLNQIYTKNQILITKLFRLGPFLLKNWTKTTKGVISIHNQPYIHISHIVKKTISDSTIIDQSKHTRGLSMIKTPLQIYPFYLVLVPSTGDRASPSWGSPWARL